MPNNSEESRSNETTGNPPCEHTVHGVVGGADRIVAKHGRGPVLRKATHPLSQGRGRSTVVHGQWHWLLQGTRSQELVAQCTNHCSPSTLSDAALLVHGKLNRTIQFCDEMPRTHNGKTQNRGRLQ